MIRTLIPLILALALAGTARAHGGEDHGDAGPAPTVAVAPRAEAHSEALELVAVLGGAQLTAWLDHYATNDPVQGAEVELESGNYKTAGKPVGEGVFTFDAGPLAQPGEHALVFTVQTADSADLLQGVLRIGPAQAAQETPRPAMTPWLGGAAGVLVAGAGLWWWHRRRHGQGARA
ncbi:MAG: hypothetical protein HY778_09875 [Betaproteobacteria bacterium]|nr:hypothetical protein [Betaproteobacteria bacterium]